MLKYYGYFSTTNVGFQRPGRRFIKHEKCVRLKNFICTIILSWKENIGNGWKLNVGASYSTNKDRINNEFQNGDNQKQEINERSVICI